MRRSAYRRKWLRYREGYERRGLRTFRKGIRRAVEKIPFDNLDKHHYKLTIEGNLHEDEIRKAFFDFYLEIGMMHGRRVGAHINKQTKFFDPGIFGEQFRQVLQAWLLDTGGLKITSMRESLAKYLIKYIGAKIEEGTAMQDIIRQVKKHVLSRGFYRWQIERIVRTETTAAANFGAVQAADNSGLVLVKEWISGADARVRMHERGDAYDHLDMNGIQTGEKEPFEVKGRGEPVDYLMFPGDPKGREANVINCRCTVALVPKRDAEGNLIFR